MSRLAKGRDRELTQVEIAAEALRLFDDGTQDPSIRALATALGVAPSAIYHHYASRAAIVRDVVELVWQEATEEFLRLTPDPFSADPVEALVAAGIATRRAFGGHHRVAPYLAATPHDSEFQIAQLALLAALFERLGLEGDAAGEAFHTYASYTIGATIFAATRRIANEELESNAQSPGAAFDAESGREPRRRRRSSDDTRHALHEMMDVSTLDPDRDEELFAAGLRQLVESLRPAA